MELTVYLKPVSKLITTDKKSKKSEINNKNEFPTGNQETTIVHNYHGIGSNQRPHGFAEVVTS